MLADPATGPAGPGPLPQAAPEALGLDAARLERLCAAVAADVARGLQPGAQLAVARHGRLALARSFGHAALGPAPRPATDDTPFLMYSNTKVLVAAGIWLLVQDGVLRFHQPVAELLPDFAAHGKGAVTLSDLLTHRGGFPAAGVTPAAWEDPGRLLAEIAAFVPAWEPGSRMVYHPSAAHWVLAAVIRAATGEDHRAFLRARLLEPLGLAGEVMLGVAPEAGARCAVIHDPAPGGGFAPRAEENAPAYRAAGVPSGGAFGTARGMAAFYQCLLAGGVPGGARLFAPRLLDFVLRDHTGDMVDGFMGLPMHRGLGPHLRGEGPRTRGLGSLAHPRVFGHGGVGSSYCWADPASGVSFAFLANCRQDEATHEARMERLSNLVHAAILPG